MAKKRRKKMNKSFLLLIIIGIFLFSFFMDRKKVDKIPVSSFNSEEEYKIFMKKYDSYPDDLLDMFERNPDMANYMLGYPEKKGNVYSDTVGKIDLGEVPLFLQYDERWGYGFYGDDVIAINGCGPTTLSMVITYLTHNTRITPYVVAEYAYQNGYYTPGSGSSWSLMTTGSEYFGVLGRNISLSKETIYHELERGNPIICSMRPGDFTKTGHFIVLTKIENGKIRVNDPNSPERSSKLWDYETLYPQIKNLWAFEKA